MSLNPPNQSYWYVVREDQTNVLYTTGAHNFTQQNVSDGETRFVINEEIPRQYQTLQSEDTNETTQTQVLAIAKKDTSFWDRHRVRQLLSLSSAPKYKHLDPAKDKLMWLEIAPTIGTTPEECTKKYVTLRNTFIRLYKKRVLGKQTKWMYYNMCEEVFKKHKFISPENLETWDDGKIRTLLTLYLENMDKICNPGSRKKTIWKEFASILGTTEYNCYHKFRSLRRTYIKISERNNDSGKITKWPYQMYFERILNLQNPTRWQHQKIKLLLDLYYQRLPKFLDSKYSKKELWSEISDVVGESPHNCDKKFRNLKLTYLKLKSLQSSGRTMKWRYFKDFERISEQPNDFFKKYKEEESVKLLLGYYIQNKEQFRNPVIKKRHIWKSIASKLGSSSYDCDKKFRNLKQTYMRLVDIKKRTGKDSDWPYFVYFEEIYGATDPLPSQPMPTNINLEDAMLTELNKVLCEAQGTKKSDDKFNRLIQAVAESNDIQRERNKILLALLNRNTDI